MEENRLKASGFVIQPRLQFESIKDKMLYQHFIDDANYKEGNCKRGQLITSSISLSKKIGWTRGDIRGSIKRLTDAGYIKSEPYKKNKGLIITIENYDDFQKLENYSKKINQLENQQGNQQDNQQGDVQTPCESKEEDDLKNDNNQPINQQGNQLKNHTITAFINSINNINKTLKEYITEAPVKNKNLTSTDDTEIFVDFASRTNAIPSGVNRKLLVSYFDCVRLTRQTCAISANILVNFIEKLQKYSANQINYAIWNHIENHDDKKEQYTLGILRNTKEPEARRGLMKLKNSRGGQSFESNKASSGEYDYGF
ncbi:hypothetical protein D5F11_021500 [Siminovitchia terrae]|uniref:Uncharacterized protein n=1 Tax=Siminovitchia terrae TaxID=1914933 RepID=A0A429X2B4_SIMTE|nr:hypothetical protein [Siminovitchia terrae]RST57639.1 hypothetical protein D5F11_021500 [Siminovitchia terrae]